MSDKMMKGAILGLFLCFLALTSAVVSAQQSTADIVGTVTDSTGAVVSNATVTVTNLATNEVRTQPVAGDGAFALTNLPVGAYNVNVTATGYRAWRTNSVSISLGDRLRLSPILAVGAVSQTVQVVSQSPALQTDTSSVGALISSQSVQDLPLNGRNFITLVQLAPGAADSTVGLATGNATDDRRLTSELQVNGQYPWADNFEIDGMDNNDRFVGLPVVKPALESIQEMRVTTSNFSADQGRTAAAVVNMVTKSGTNDLHGSAFEYLRNQVMDARNYFARVGVVQKPAYRQNQYGGSLGSRIQKDKSFYYLDYEALRLGQATVSSDTVPLANGEAPAQPSAAVQAMPGYTPYNGSGGERTGNFSGFAPIYDPTSCTQTGSTSNCPSGRTQFPGNVIPVNRQDKAGIALLNLYPLPNNGAAGALTSNFLATPVTVNNEDTMDVRLDDKFSDKNSAYLRYTYGIIRVIVPSALNVKRAATAPAFGTTTNESTHALAWDIVHTFNPHLLLELQMGYERYQLATLPGSYGTNDAAKLLGMQNIDVSPYLSQIPVFSVTDGSISGSGDSSFNPEYNTDNVGQVILNIDRQAGYHNFKFGGNWIMRSDTQDQSQYPAGDFVFSTEQTQNVTSAGSFVSNTGFGVASEVIGYPNSSTRIVQLSQPNYEFQELSLYAQDDWRVNHRLTLNLGVRYDYYGAQYTPNCQLVNYNFKTEALQTACTGGYGESAGVTIGSLNFSPRVGFAATLTNKTTIHGAFGTVYVPYLVASAGAMRNAPFTSQFSTLQNQYFPVLSLTNTNPAGGPNSAYAGVIPIMPVPTPDSQANPVNQILATRDNEALPYLIQANLALQHQFGANVASVWWVGIYGKQQPWPNVSMDLNQAAPGPAVTAQARRPFYSLYPNVTNLDLYGNQATNNFNGLQASLERRMSRGLEAIANYSWGHAIDNYDYQPLSTANVVANPLGGYRQIAGNSEIDLQQRFTATETYHINTSLHGIAGAAVNNWDINTIFYTQTGLPFNPANSTDVVGDSSEETRPSVVGDYRKPGAVAGNPTCNAAPYANVHSSHAHATSGNGNIQWFNGCAFAVQTQGTYGTLGRNEVFGPHETGLAFSVFKEFPIRERLRMQLRGEMFNALNHPQFGLPATGVGSSNFGQISGTAFGNAGLPRNIQISVKFIF